MKLFATLLLFVSAWFQPAQICDHAASASSVNPGIETGSHQHDHASHASARHEIPADETEGVGRGSENHGCPDDCAGGIGCKGCTFAAPAVLSDSALSLATFPRSDEFAATRIARERLPLSDPPPPRLY